MKPRIAHDAAHRAAVEIINVFAPLLREEERRDAYEEVMPILLSAIENYERQAARTAERLCETEGRSCAGELAGPTT